VDFNNHDALKKYFELLLALMRVIDTAVLALGPQNQQSIVQARSFILENRTPIVSIFKRHAKIGGTKAENAGDLEDLVESIVLLISMTDFLEVNISNNSHH
jgi:nuclear pore complex protein Nup205